MEPNVVDPFAYDPDAAAEREARRDAVESANPRPDESEFVWCDPATLAPWPRETDGPADSALPDTETEPLDPALVTTRRRTGVVDGAISRLAAVRRRVEGSRQGDED